MHPGKGGVQSGQNAALLKTHEFFLVEKVAGPVLFTENKPIPASRFVVLSLLQKSPERRQPGAGTDHDNIPGTVLRQPEFKLGREHGDVVPIQLGMIRQPTRRQAFPFSAVVFVANDCDQ